MDELIDYCIIHGEFTVHSKWGEMWTTCPLCMVDRLDKELTEKEVTTTTVQTACDLLCNHK